MNKDPILLSDKEREENLFAEVWVLCKKYGYDHYFMVAGEATNQKEHVWIGKLQETWFEGTLNAVDQWVDFLREKYGFERQELEIDED